MSWFRAAVAGLILALVGACGDTEGGGDEARLPTAGWRSIAAGSFVMGSPTSESCRDTKCETAHTVTLTCSFEMAPTEVVQGNFKQLMGYNPSKSSSCGTDCPVEMVTLHEARAFCNAMSAEAGYAPCYDCIGSKGQVNCRSKEAYATYTGGSYNRCPGYRLPTEAEWEYAYRAGTQTASFAGQISVCTSKDRNADSLGWYEGNSSGAPHPVKKKPQNPWGLYDMAGNVWEWVNDRFVADLGPSDGYDPEGPATGTRYSLRGGCWNSYARDLRAAARRGVEPESTSISIGFRCARSLCAQSK